jgi:hypothetical protein
MVHQCKRNGLRVADELYIKRGLLGLEDSLLFWLYRFSSIAKQVTTLEQLQLVSCPDFLDFNFESFLSCFDTIFKTSISPTPDPARYTRTSHTTSYLTLNVPTSLYRV